MFCEQCGARVAVDPSPVPVEAVVPSQEMPPSSGGTSTWWTKRNVFKLTSILLIGIVTYFGYTLGWKYYQFHAAVSDHRYDEAFKIYHDAKNQPVMALTERVLDGRLDQDLANAIDDYAANELIPADLETALDYFERANPKLITEGVTKKLTTIRDSKDQFAKALELKKAQQYFESLAALKLVDKLDAGNYPKAQTEMKSVKKQMYDVYKQSIEKAMADREFIAAFATLKKLLEVYPDDSKLKELQQNSKTAYVDNVIESADQEVRADQYEEALALIDAAIESVGADAKLTEARKTYQEMADELVAERADPVDLKVGSIPSGIQNYYGFNVQMSNTSRFALRSVTVMVSLKTASDQIVGSKTHTFYDIPALGNGQINTFIYSNDVVTSFSYQVTDVQFEEFVDDFVTDLDSDEYLD